MNASRPLHPSRRDGFLQAVAHELQGCAEIGPGSVHRAIASVQRQHFDRLDLSRGAPGRGLKVPLRRTPRYDSHEQLFGTK
jgi:hypothetical protein